MENATEGNAALALGLLLLRTLAERGRLGGHPRLPAPASAGKARKKKAPSAAILDSQSVKTSTQPGVRGYDAGKKVMGRKRHILVDTLGLIMLVMVHSADIQDRAGARLVLAKLKGIFGSLKLIWVDGGYSGKLQEWLSVLMPWR